MINAFTKSKNIPKVTIVIGKVKMTRMGFTNEFKNAKMAATTNAVK